MTRDGERPVAGQRSAAETGPEPNIRWLLVSLVTVAFVFNTVGRGVPETFAVFLLPVEDALGASRSEIAATYSIFMLVLGLAAPFAGQMVDRLGARLTYGAGLTLLGSAYLLAAEAQTLLHYYIAIGGIAGLGSACLGMVIGTSLLSRWFSRRIGSAMAVPYAAIGFGGLVVPPFAQYLMSISDWRVAHQVLGAIPLSLLLLVFIAPMRRFTEGSRDWQLERANARQAGAATWSLTRAVRTRAFWALFAIYFWTAVAAYSVLPHSVAHLVERGLDPATAAAAFGLTGALSTIGIVGMGVISDRLGRFWTVMVSYIVTMLGIAALWAVAGAQSWAFLAAFVVCFGLMQGVRGPVIAALVAILYRGGSVGAIFGALSMALGSGAGVGSYLSGVLHDATGTYEASFGVAIAACVAGMVSYAWSASLKQERLDARSTQEATA